VQLALWANWDLEKEMKASAVLAGFEQKNNASVVLTYVPGYDEKFNAAAAGKTLPDVFTVDGVKISQRASRDLLTPVSDFIDKAVLDDYFPVALGEVRWKGKHWGVSIENICMGMVYNLDLLANKGIKSVPKTWDEWLAQAKASNDPSNRVWGTNVPFTVVWHVLTYVVQNGGGMLNPDMTRATVNQSAGVEAIQFLADLVLKHEVAPSDWVQPLREQAFVNQKEASENTGSWNLDTWTKTPLKFGWTFAPLAFPAGKQHVQGGAAGWHFAQWKETKNAEKAAALMTFLTGEDWLVAATKTFRTISPRKSIAAKTEALKQEPWASAMKVIEVSQALRPVHPNWAQVESPYAKALQKIFQGKEPVQASLDQAAREIDAVLASS